MKGKILFFLFLAIFLALYHKLIFWGWNKIQFTLGLADGLGIAIGFTILFFVVLPLALITARIVTHYFLPDADI